MATSDRNIERFAGKVATFIKQQDSFVEFVFAEFCDSELTTAQAIKCFRQEYEPVYFFWN